MIQEHVQRGKVDMTLSVAARAGGTSRIDREAASAWARELDEMAGDLGIRSDLGVADLLPLPGVMSVGDEASVDPEEDTPVIEKALRTALEGLGAMRAHEGTHLAQDLGARVDLLDGGLRRIENAAAELPARIRDQLRERVGELLAEVGAPVDESRLIQEAAYYAERADVTEETVRLRSHLDKTRDLLQSSDSVGRALEFVAQEIHRELTTIGAKTKDLAVADEVLGLKSELEKIREQVQNIE